MASVVHCSIVSAEREIFSGMVEMVVATGTIGELGILPGHTPLLTGVKPGPVRLKLEGGEEQVFFASGGFIEVQPTAITILADTAVRADDLDEVGGYSVCKWRPTGRSPWLPAKAGESVSSGQGKAEA